MYQISRGPLDSQGGFGCLGERLCLPGVLLVTTQLVIGFQNSVTALKELAVWEMHKKGMLQAKHAMRVCRC